MGVDDLYRVQLIPTSPTNFTFRPMTRGIIRSASSLTAPDGSFLDIQGFDVQPQGLQRQGGWQPTFYNPVTLLPEAFPFLLPLVERLEDQIQMWLEDGTSLNLAITNRFLYRVDLSLGIYPLGYKTPYTVDEVTAGTGYTDIVVAGDPSDEYLAAGDYIQVAGVLYSILSVGETPISMTIRVQGEPPLVANDTFQVFKPFLAGNDYFVDFVQARNVLYLVDGRTPLVFKFRGQYLEPHIITNTLGERTILGARTIAYFADRLYFGDVLEGLGGAAVSYLRQRIRWTDVLDLSKGQAQNYQDLTRTSGRVLKILGMGNLLMAYLSDGVFYGRQTNLVALPYVFAPLETGGVTVVGMKAACSFFDGQAFVGPDNVYLVTPSATLQPLGDTISELLLDDMEYPEYTVIRSDPARTRLYLGCAKGTRAITQLYFFNYRTKAWSRTSNQPILAPQTVQFVDELLWQEVPAGDTWATSPLRHNSWLSLRGANRESRLLAFQQNGYFLEYNEELQQNRFVDAAGVIQETPLIGYLETPDFDFDDPDGLKTALRLACKITEKDRALRTEAIRFTVEGSTDRGLTWRYLGTLNIRPNKDEDGLNFRITGSTIRFRLRQGEANAETATLVPPYLISEITVRLRERSLETYGETSRPGVTP